MEKITVEQIDAVRSRADVTYKEAKEILEQFDGDIVSVLLYLEDHDKTKSDFKNETDKYIKKGKNFVSGLKKTRVKINTDGRTSLDINGTNALFITLLAPHITMLTFGMSFFKGYKINFEKELEFDLTKK